jgi:hypothetical protein
MIRTILDVLRSTMVDVGQDVVAEPIDSWAISHVTDNIGRTGIIDACFGQSVQHYSLHY